MSGSAESMAILVTSWDGYAKVWDPFFRCFFRHWPDCPYPVYLGSNTKTYDDPRVLPVLFGAEVDYSSNIIKMLEQVHEEWICLWVDDFALAEDVDTTRVARVMEIARREQASYVNLTAFPDELTPLFTVGNLGGEVGELARGAPYRFALGTCVWRRETLLAALKPGETAWQIERNGSLRLDEMPDRFLFISKARVKHPPIRVINMIQEGRWTRKAVTWLTREGMADLLAGRDVESPWRATVVFVYSRIRYLTAWTLSTLGGRAARAWMGRMIAGNRFSIQN